MNHEEAANKLQESLDYMDSVFPAKRRQATIDLLDALRCGIAALREKAERSRGCDWCIGFCPDVTGDTYADYKYCPMCGKPLKGGE